MSCRWRRSAGTRAPWTASPGTPCIRTCWSRCPTIAQFACGGRRSTCRSHHQVITLFKHPPRYTAATRRSASGRSGAAAIDARCHDTFGFTTTIAIRTYAAINVTNTIHCDILTSRISKPNQQLIIFSLWHLGWEKSICANRFGWKNT